MSERDSCLHRDLVIMVSAYQTHACFLEFFAVTILHSGSTGGTSLGRFELLAGSGMICHSFSKDRPFSSE